MSTVTVLEKLALQVRAGATYESGAMQQVPYLSGRITQMFDPIQSEGISGTGFRDIPQQGPRHVESSGLSVEVDADSIAPILEAAFGNVNAGVYTLGDNAKKLSVAALDGVSCNQYANVYVKSLQLEGSSSSIIKATANLIGATAQVRAARSAFPVALPYSEPFTMHHAGGTGYIRIGDASDALQASDEIKIDSFSLNFDNMFDNQYTNEGLGTLTPLFGQGGFMDVGGSLTVARHETDQFQQWAEDFTPLQLEIYLYRSATESIKIQVPRFIITAEPTDDDLAKISINMNIGRNGSGTSYKNANMAFVSPIAITLVNS